MSSFFQSIASVFAPARRDGQGASSSRQTLSYTHDAFTLPTHSPTTSQLDASTHSRGPSAFQYPPATPSTNTDDAFIPLSSSDRLNRSSQAAGNSLLPMYQPRSASLSHPPLDKTWERIRAWLASEYPELGDTLNYGILPEALAEIELNLGLQLPRAVRESYLVVDGQEAESSAGCSEGLFFGLTFLPLEDVLEEWRFWREVDEDPSTGANPQLLDAMQSIPDGWIRRAYSCRGWIPLVTDKAGNYIGIDLSPPTRPLNPDGTTGLGGSAGQVIIFGRDFDTKIVLWRGDGESGWARWLASFVEELETGEGFEVRGSETEKDGSDDDSEDSVGYESYFFAGAGGGKGGDAGGGGSMRFTGEYKGWNAIEVWADRSYKRWHAAGLVPDVEVEEAEPVAGPSGQATSTMAGEATQPALTTADLPPTSSKTDDDTLDSATPTELVAPPNRLTSMSATSTTTASNTQATLSSIASQTPLLPPPNSSVVSSRDSADLLSLSSPELPSTSSGSDGAATKTAATATSGTPLQEPLVSIGSSSPPSLITPPSTEANVTAPATVEQALNSDDLPPESTIRLVSVALLDL